MLLLIINMDGKFGEFRLFAEDFPDWIEDKGVGLKLAPDQRTTTILKKVLNNLEDNKDLYFLFKQINGDIPINNLNLPTKNTSVFFNNSSLNSSQQQAVVGILQNNPITILHGPPGTGKTTTLVEAIIQLVKFEGKILVSAPSNAAVDNIAKTLIDKGLHVLRVGNISKVDEALFAHTIEGKIFNSPQQKEIKQLKIQAEAFRKMAVKYKRNFGKAEKEQRYLLFTEVKNIRAQIKKLQAYNEEKLYAQAQIIAGTPIALYDAKIKHLNFSTLIIDEAGQCIEPLAWCIFPLAKNYVLAGDPLQLPPTVLSNEAAKLGFSTSVLEKCMNTISPIYLVSARKPLIFKKTHLIYVAYLGLKNILFKSPPSFMFFE